MIQRRAPAVMGRALATSLVVAVSMGAGSLPLQPAPASGDRGALEGMVLASDGRPLAGGVARLVFIGWDTEVPIDTTGRFRFEAIQPGSYELQLAAGDLPPHSVRVAVPPDGPLTLPPIRLPEPVYVRIRVVSPGGEPILNPGVVYKSYDVTGKETPVRSGERVSASTDGDGLTTIGPLPRGIFAFAVDAPPWARTRLPDVVVTGERVSIDLGMVRLEPGATVDVDVFDETGAPVPNHSVWLDDGSPLLPARFVPTPTDVRGRARFERLATGRYRVRTRASRPCGIYTPTMERRISISGVAPIRQRVAVSGVSVRVRLTAGDAPLASTEVSLSPDIAPPALPSWLRGDDRFWLMSGPLGRIAQNVCGDTTDREGLVTIRYVPSGPARASVRFANSTWVRRVSIPARDGDLALDVPQGVVSLRVFDQRTGDAAAGASITWASGGGEVDARVPATGDVLLEAIHDGPGDLVVRKEGYALFKERFLAPPPVLHTVALQRLPETSLQCRVQDASGKAIAGAVVTLVPGDPLELTQLAGTDRRGMVRFSSLPTGAVRLTAAAHGYTGSEPVNDIVPIAPPGSVVSLTLK